MESRSRVKASAGDGSARHKMLFSLRQSGL